MRLNPKDYDTLNLLGHILWKKKDLKGSKHCFEESIKLKKNKKGLRYLSIIMRSIPCEPKDKAEMLKKSLELAK